MPLLPATPKTLPPQTTSQRAATTSVAHAARTTPSSASVARRLSYSDATCIHQSHGERDPSRAAVSDEDTYFEDDPDLDPDDWQDQYLYDDDLLHHVYALCSHATLLVVVRTIMRLHLVAHGLSLMIGLLPVLVLLLMAILTSRRAVMPQVVSI
jgi:hypothetical protein